uniref:Uncharacterized protein n=1 Tax=Plectus sambesii TaxID=2011161 RepID=A0A914WQY6_9BILA
MDTISPYLDIALTFPLAALLLGAIPLRRRSYWYAELAFHVAVGASLFLLPGFIFTPLVSAPLDALHFYLLRFVGAFHLGIALTSYISRNNIGYMTGTVFYSRAVAAFFVLIAEYFTVYHLWDKRGLHPNEKFLIVATALHGVWLLGSLVHLLRTVDGVSGFAAVNKGWLSHGLILDGAICLFTGVIHFAFPSQVLKLIIKSQYTIDGVHICFTRLFGAMMFGASIASHFAPGYSNDNKKAHLFGRILTHGLIFLLNVYGHFQLDIFSMYHVTPFMLSGFYITFLLSIYFRLQREEDKLLREKQR